MNCKRCGNEEHEAGREMDACVAELVMGETVRVIGDRYILTDGLPHYSTNIADAWSVVEKLKGPSRGDSFAWNWGIELSWLEDVGLATWNCRIGLAEAEADTAPLAICLAALEVVNGTQA